MAGRFIDTTRFASSRSPPATCFWAKNSIASARVADSLRPLFCGNAERKTALNQTACARVGRGGHRNTK
jgi:hypothetical protein